MSKKKKEYTKRSSSQYNKWRGFFQDIVCKFGYMIRFKLVYRLEVHGLENVPEDNEYIVCPNHLSTLDPPLMVSVLPRHVAFMAKKELFEPQEKFSWLIKRLGAFAVDRTKPEIATFKTVRDVFTTSWSLGVFPQGGTRPYGKLEGIKKGFVVIAKNAKADIIPVAIDGFDGYPKLKPFTRRNVQLHIGKPISYKLPEDVIIYEWCKQISELADYENLAPIPESYQENTKTEVRV